MRIRFPSQTRDQSFLYWTDPSPIHTLSSPIHTLPSHIHTLPSPCPILILGHCSAGACFFFLTKCLVSLVTERLFAAAHRRRKESHRHLAPLAQSWRRPRHRYQGNLPAGPWGRGGWEISCLWFLFNEKLNHFGLGIFLRYLTVTAVFPNVEFFKRQWRNGVQRNMEWQDTEINIGA